MQACQINLYLDIPLGSGHDHPLVLFHSVLFAQVLNSSIFWSFFKKIALRWCQARAETTLGGCDWLGPSEELQFWELSTGKQYEIRVEMSGPSPSSFPWLWLRLFLCVRDDQQGKLRPQETPPAHLSFPTISASSLPFPGLFLCTWVISLQNTALSIPSLVYALFEGCHKG